MLYPFCSREDYAMTIEKERHSSCTSSVPCTAGIAFIDNTAPRSTDWVKQHTNDLISAVLNKDTHTIIKLFSETLLFGSNALQIESVEQQQRKRRPDDKQTIVNSFHRVAIFSDLSPDADAIANRLMKLVRDREHMEIRPDLVLCNASKTRPEGSDGFDGLVFLSSVRDNADSNREPSTGVPCFLDVLTYFNGQLPSLVHILTPGPLGIYAIIVAKALNIPTILHFHSNFISQAISLLKPTIPHGVLQSIIVILFQQATSILVTSQPAYRECLRLINSTESIHYFPSLVDVSLFSPLARKDICPFNNEANDAFRVICHQNQIARLDVLYSAVQLLRERGVHTALIVLTPGNIPDDNQLLRMETSVENIHVVPCTDLRDRARYLAWSDVFVYFEDCGSEVFDSVLEAQASGLPAIRIGAEGTSDWIDEDITGFIVNDDNIELLAAAIARFALDSELKECFGACARGKVLSETKPPFRQLYQNFCLDLIMQLKTESTNPEKKVASHNVIRLSRDNRDVMAPKDRVIG